MYLRTGQIVLLAVLSSAACMPILDERSAEQVIRAHLTEVAPNGLEGLSWEDVTVDVVDIARGTDGLREVSFRAYRSDLGLRGSPDSEAGATFTTLLRSERGQWEIAGYGDALANSMAALVANDLRHQYADLLPILEQVQDRVYARWRPWMRDQKKRLRYATAEERPAIVRAMEAGPDAEYLMDGVALEETPPGVEWGVFRSGRPVDGQVVWVRSRGTTCAMAFGQRVPEEYAWVDPGSRTCDGRGARYVEVYAQVEAAERIAGNGGVYPRRSGS